jgi:hypothetical protein
MDMMRPVSLALPPLKPDGLAYTITGSGNKKQLVLTWNDNSIAETAFVVQKTIDGTTWTNVGTVQSPLDQPNTHGTRTLTDAAFNANAAALYRVVAQNTVGYGAEFPTMTVQSVSANLGVNKPVAPTNLTVTLQAGPQVSLTWRDNAITETGFVIERAVNGGAFAQIATAPARNSTGNVTLVDTTTQAGNAYSYRVAAMNIAGMSAYSNAASATIPAMPVAPGSFNVVIGPNGSGNSRTVILTWADLSDNETVFTIQRATNVAFTQGLTNIPVGTNVTTLTQTGLSRNTQYWYRIRANNGTFVFTVWVNASPFPIRTNP